MAHQPMDPIVLDQMYEHPERFTHMEPSEYIKLLIDDIRFYREQLGLNVHGTYDLSAAEIVDNATKPI